LETFCCEAPVASVYYRVVDDGIFELCESVCGSVQRQVAELHAILGGTGR
jgi:hypothetical protein